MRSVWQRYITDSTGAVRPGATVVVRNQSDNSLANIYTALSGGSPIAGSTITSDSTGLAIFYADPGVYKVVATFGLNTATFENVEMGPALRGDDATFNSLTIETFSQGKVIDVVEDAGVFTVDWNLASVFRMTITDDCSFDFINIPPVEDGVERVIYLVVTNGGAHSITYLSDVDIKTSGGAPVALTAVGVDYLICAINSTDTLIVIPILDIKVPS